MEDFLGGGCGEIGGIVSTSERIKVEDLNAPMTS